MFEAVVTLLDPIVFSYAIIAKDQLDILDNLRLIINKLLAIFDAIYLLDDFSYLR